MFFLPTYRHAFFLLFVVIASTTYADARKRMQDDYYVRTFPQTVTLRVFLGEKISSFRIDDAKSGHTIRYLPNNHLDLGAGATIRGVGLNFATPLPYHDTKESLYGHTGRFDLQVHSYGRKLMLDAYYQQYKGYHLNTKEDVTSVTGPEEYPYFSTLRTRAIGVSGLYVFNGDRYSLRTIVNQQEWQMHSAGSFLAGGSIFTHFFGDDNKLLPYSYKHNDFIDGHQPKEIKFYGLTLNAGYGYTLVLDQASHYFIAAAVDGGAGPGHSSVQEVNAETENNGTYCLTGNVRLGAGYNSERWFAGFYFIYHADRYKLPYDKSSLTTNQGIGRFVIARRFNTKKSFLANQRD